MTLTSYTSLPLSSASGVADGTDHYLRRSLQTDSANSQLSSVIMGLFEISQVDVSPDTTTENTKLALASTVLSNLFLFLLIFGLSATVQLKSLKKQLTNKCAIFSGVVMQFIVMPALGGISVLLFRNLGLSYPMAVALLVVTSSPGGSYSNWWCSMFNAELALSVAMTTCSSLLSVVMLPLNLFLYSWVLTGYSSSSDDEGNNSIVQSLDFGSIFTSLGIVMGAIILGLYVGYLNDTPQFHVWANRLGSGSGVCLILFSIFLSSGVDGSESKIWNQPWAFYVAVSIPCFFGILLSNVASRTCLRLSKPETVAIAIECCYQNTGIATSVAITMFRDNKNDRAMAIAVPFFYGVLEAVVIGIYCLWAWKSNWTKAPANEPFCVMLSKTYEVNDEEKSDEAKVDKEGNIEKDEQTFDAEQGRSCSAASVTENSVETNVRSIKDSFDSLEQEKSEQPQQKQQQQQQQQIQQQSRKKSSPGCWGRFFWWGKESGQKSADDSDPKNDSKVTEDHHGIDSSSCFSGEETN